MTKTYETTEMINRLQDMANQILSPDSEGKQFFEAVADRLRQIPPPVDNAHVAPGCEQFKERTPVNTGALEPNFSP